MEQEFNFPRGSSEALGFVEKFLQNWFPKVGKVGDWNAAGGGGCIRGRGFASEEGAIAVNGQGGEP